VLSGATARGGATSTAAGLVVAVVVVVYVVAVSSGVQPAPTGMTPMMSAIKYSNGKRVFTASNLQSFPDALDAFQSEAIRVPLALFAEFKGFLRLSGLDSRQPWARPCTFYVIGFAPGCVERRPSQRPPHA
jgi:hypothetical protein